MRRRVAGLVLAGAVAVLAACGGSDGGTGPTVDAGGLWVAERVAGQALPWTASSYVLHGASLALVGTTSGPGWWRECREQPVAGGDGTQMHGTMTEVRWRVVGDELRVTWIKSPAVPVDVGPLAGEVATVRRTDGMAAPVPYRFRRVSRDPTAEQRLCP